MSGFRDWKAVIRRTTSTDGDVACADEAGVGKRGLSFAAQTSRTLPWSLSIKRVVSGRWWANYDTV